ncbi:MAG: GAF domain-containing protein [Deltaproteobacteria bacterium]|nr:MAG: GAF domain-containing protein [Deltaproteobacteria bacterium]
MKNVLFVDDEKTLLHIMVSRFSDYKDRFNVLTAGNGKEAVEILESHAVDLVVTDLKMPVMDGIELLAYMSANFPSIPAIAVSAYCTPKIQKKLEGMGTVRVMDKPVNLDLLAEAVMEGLERSHQGGSINCVSLSSFLQIIEMEEKTCSLEVHGEGDLRGHFYLIQGELYDASCGVLSKEEAAYAMLAWENVQLFIKNLPRERPKKRIEKGLMSVVMEALRRKDEMINEGKAGPIKPEPKTENKTDSDKPASSTEILEEGLVSELNNMLEGMEEDALTPDAKQSAIGQSQPKPKAADKVEFNQKIFGIIHSNLDPGKLLRALVKELQRIIDVDLVVLISRVGDKTDYLRIDDLIGDSSKTIRKGAVYPCEGSHIVEALKQKNPLIFNMNGSVPSGIEREMLESHGIQSCFYVPILSDDIVSGLLALGAKKTANFSAVRDYMDWIASGLSLAIERNRLTAAMTKQKEAMDVSQQIGLALVSRSYDIEKVIKFSMDHVRQILNVEAGTLFLKEKEQLKAAIAFNSKVNVIKKFRLKIGQGIAGCVAAKGKPMIVNDTKNSSQFFQEIDKLTGFKTRSVLCVPLLSHNKLIGVLEVLNKIDGDFDTIDETVLLSLANSIVLVLMSAHLHKQRAQAAHAS